MINYAFSTVDFEFFVLVLVRVLSFVFVAPFFSMSNTPRRVRIAFGFMFAVLMYHVLTPVKAEFEYNTVEAYSVLVLKEAIVGILIGFGATICNSIVNLAGSVIDMEVGLSMVNLVDPATKESVTVSGVFYQYMVTLLLIVTGMHRYLIKAFAETYTLIPVDGAVFNYDELLVSFAKFMGESISIAFRICLPIFAIMILLNAVLGVLAKVAPQMNMFAVGMQLKVLVGLGAMFLTVGMLPGIADFVFTEMKTMVAAFVRGMGGTL